MQGTLYIISAPSGAGKTSLVRALVAQTDDIGVSISTTTRPMRAGETDGVHYHFMDQETFQSQVARGEFLEYATVFGNSYGSSRTLVTAGLASGTDLILEIDWQGAQLARRQIAGSISIFILPPSRSTLEERLHGRGQDDESVIARRLSKAREEMSHYAEFDYLVVNDDFDTALADLRAIVHGQRLKTGRQAARLAPVLQELLARD